MNGHYLMLGDLLDKAPADHPVQRWRGILAFGPVAVVWPAWAGGRFWVLTTGKDQERVFLKHESEQEPDQEPVVGSLGFMNSIRYGWSDRPFENVKEAAEDLLAVNPTPERQ